MSTIDPDVQAAFSGGQPAASPQSSVDPDISEAFKDSQSPLSVSSETGSQHFGRLVDVAKQHPLTIGVGMLENAVSGVTGGLSQFYDAVTGSEPGTYAKSGAVYIPKTEAGKQLAAIGATEQSKLSHVVDVAARSDARTFGLDPDAYSQTLRERGSEALGAVGTVTGIAGIRGGFRGASAPELVSPIEQGHPLTSAAQAEVDRMSGHIAAAKSQGLQLVPREVSPAQTYVDNAARRDLNLPGNSPVTSGVLDAADKQNVSPHYAAAQKFAPDLVQASKQGRSVARGLYDDASNMNLTFAQRQAARTEAQASYQAAKDAEAEFRARVTAAGQPELADNWDAARVYKAKLETWRDALQGGVEGHVNGLKIRKLGLADEPLSGAQAEAASVAAQHPDQFGSGIAVPRPGPVGRLIRKVAPVAGAAAGGAIAPGVVGPMVGAELAGSLADRVIR